MFLFIWDECATVGILLDVGWLCGKGVVKQSVTSENLVVERKKEEQQNKEVGGGEVCFSVGKGFEKRKVGFLFQIEV